MTDYKPNESCSYSVQGVSKYYGKFKALDQVDMELGQGKIIGLLGKNGAGKSTLMRCMLGFLNHSGRIELCGKEVKPRDKWLFNDVAFIPDVSGLDDRLTVQQSIDYVKGVNPGWNDAIASSLLEISNLPLKKKVAKLSKGMKTKLYLLITLSLDVNYLLLDEPTLGLDIAFRKEFFNNILGEFFDESKTILISTHQVEEVEDILQEIIFIDNGRLILHEEVDKLKSRYRVVSVSSDREAELRKYNPRVLSRSLGFVSAVLDTAIEIPEAHYSGASCADIFLEIVGGNQ